MPDTIVDLAELERAFAQDPISDAFLALSRAYLEQSRFMEAMVVCKKGIKSRPDSLEGRLLLAQVYAGQSKLPKALAETAKLLQEHADFAEAHFFQGDILDKSGRPDEAIESFRACLALEPHHENAITAVRAKGIEYEPGPSPEEIAAKEAEEAEAARIAAEEAAKKQAVEVSTQAPVTSVTPPSGTGPVTSQIPMQSGQSVAGQSAYMGGYDPLAMQESRKGKMGAGFTFGLMALLLLFIGGFVLYLNANKERAEAIADLTTKARKHANSGTTFGLKKAAEKYQQIMEIDDAHPASLAAYAYNLELLSIRRGLRKEYGDEGKTTVERAQKKAKKKTRTVAAAMLYAFGEGKADDALAIYADASDKAKTDERVLMVQGMVFMAQGKTAEMPALLEKLKEAKDPNVLTWVGETWRRLGDRVKAWDTLSLALRTSPDHGPAHAMRALMVLEVKDLDLLPMALDDIQQVLELGKDNIGKKERGYSMLGRAELERLNKREKESERYMEVAKRALNKDASLAFFEAKWAFAKGKSGKAEGISFLKKSIERDPYWVLPRTMLIESSSAKDAEAAYEDAKKIFADNFYVDLAWGKAQAKSKSTRVQGATYLDELAKKYDRPEVNLLRGRLLLIKKKTDQAVEVLQKAAKATEGKSTRRVQAEVYTMLGRALQVKDDNDNAIEAFKSALGASSNYAPAYYYLGNALVVKEQLGAAKQAYEKCIKLDPSSKEAKKSAARKEKL
ncbi:MAG: tetratricopeptide repeat protein [Deltaproteobacteria bacterium]|nr:tetratricopeptide repeat protein [Deltaproteobacteria bacterium]